MAKRTYKLRYLHLFEEDLTEIIDYIFNQLKNQIKIDHYNNHLNDKNGRLYFDISRQ